MKLYELISGVIAMTALTAIIVLAAAMMLTGNLSLAKPALACALAVLLVVVARLSVFVIEDWRKP